MTTKAIVRRHHVAILAGIAVSLSAAFVRAQCTVGWLPDVGLDNQINALAVLPDGDVVAGGTFHAAGGVPADLVARWHDGTWSPLGTGLGSGAGPADVRSVYVTRFGEVLTGGYFTLAGGAPVGNVARWDGANWHALGLGFNAPTLAFLELPNGDLIATGGFTTADGAPALQVARWDGNAWSPMGTGLSYPGQTALGRALVRLPNGDIVVGGDFYAPGGAVGLARWDGAAWQPMVTGFVAGVRALAVRPNGDLIVAGAFVDPLGVTVRGVARWDGLTWDLVGATTGNIAALAVLPNGHVVIAGAISAVNGVPVTQVARWDGANWFAFGPGTNSSIYALATLPNGEVAAGGFFVTVGGVPSPRFARLATSCPATAVPFGAGCIGSGGPNQLFAATLPWVGADYASLAIGLPASAVAVAVYGLGTVSIPLPAIVPQGVVGCTMLVSPDLLELWPVVGGQAAPGFAIPPTATLAGFALHQQVVAVEANAVAGIVALTSTNALTLTIGAY